MDHLQVLKTIRDAIPEIDGLGYFPNIICDDSFCDEQEILGRYHAYQNRISIKSTTDALTLAHEVGHWAYEKIFEREIEKHQISKSPFTGKIFDHDWCELKNNNSESARHMLKLFETIKKTDYYQELEKWTGSKKDIDILYFGSFLLLSENWANAFAQTVAICGNDSGMIDDLETSIKSATDELDSDLSICLSDTNGYWPKEEFLRAKLGDYVKDTIRAAV